MAAPRVQFGGPMGNAPVTIEVPGHGRVQVSGNFNDLSAADQQAAIDEIVAEWGPSQQQQPNQTEVTPQPGYADQLLNALPVGGAMAAEPIVRGIAGTVQGAGEVLDNAAELAQGAYNQTAGRLFGQSDSATQANEAGQGLEGVAAPLDTSEHPSNTVGRVVGNIAPTLLLPGGPAVQGMGAGAVLSDAETAGGLARDVAIGGVGGKVASLAARGVSAIVSPRVSDATRRLHERGVRMTPGQVSPALRRTEERLTSRPFVGDRIVEGRQQSVRDFNRVAIEEPIAPYNEFAAANGRRPIQVPPTSTGNEAVKHVGDELSSRYGSIIPRLRFRSDPQLEADMGALRATLGNGDLTPAALRQFEKIVRNQVMPRVSGREIPGRAFRQIEKDISRQIRRFGRSDRPDDEAMRNAFEELQDVLQAGLRRSNPSAAAELEALHAGWARLVRVEGAADRAVGGLFSPLQFRGAVRRADNSTRNRAMARGEALSQRLADDASDVLPSSYPDSGTAGRTQMNPLDPRYWIGMGQGALYGQPTQRLLSNALLTPRPAGAEQITKALNFLPAPQAGAAGALAISNPLLGY